MENSLPDKKTKRQVEGLVLGIVVGTGLGAGYGYIEYRNYHTITNLSLEDVNQDGTKDFVLKSDNRTRYIFTQTGEDEYSLLIPSEETKTVYELKK